VAGLRPGAIRVFGGTTANYWDWRAGKLLDRPGVPPRLRRIGRKMKPIHLSDWARLVDGAHAIPVFDLNLVTASLSDELAMLHAAQHLGMPVHWIELGNELYFGDQLILRKFPTPESYGREATRWIKAIKADFPNAQIAAVGLGFQSNGGRGRRGGWDRRVHKTLRGESALTFHTYWKVPAGRRLSGKKLATALAAPIRRFWLLRSGGLRRLPKGVDAWVTEWNVWHTAGLRGTWANGLSDAEYLLALMAEPSVGQEDLHPLIHSRPLAALFGNSHGFGDGTSTVRFAPTAVGEAIGELYPALRGGAQVQALDVPKAPRIRGTRIAAVRGVAVQGAQGRQVLLVNLTGRWQRLQLATGLACGGRLDSVWAEPSARIDGTPGQVHRRTLGSQGSFSLPSYSISRLTC
jgi:hypothetical protein